MTPKIATIAVAPGILALMLSGCAGYSSAGANLNGFPRDEKCAEFWGKDPMYKGNVALAYATHCVSGSM